MEPFLQANSTFDTGSVVAVHRETEQAIQVLSDEGRRLFELINFTLLCSIVGFLGIVGNIISIMIFYKQGFNNTVNIAFFGLAISDLCCLIALEGVSIGMNPLLDNSSIPWVPGEVMFLAGAWPHACFCRITSYITGYITAERYLCAAIPLKVKQIITTKVTKISIFVIYLVNIFMLTPDYVSIYLGWKFVANKNRTLIGLIFTENRKQVEGLQNIFHSLLGMGSFIAVIVFTATLVGKLNEAAKWRSHTASISKQSGAISRKDRMTMKMVVSIAIVLIVCYTPGAVIALTTYIVGPEFNIQGRHLNIFISMWSIADLCQSFNSSINIILYYNMSSKYRKTFLEIILKSPQG